MPGGAEQRSRGGGQGPSTGAVTAEPSWVAERPSAVTRVRSGRPAGGRQSEDVRTPARPVVALSASSGPALGCPSSRSSGRPTSRRPMSSVHASGVQASGVRTDRPPLSAAMPPRGPHRAGPGVAGSGGRPAGRSGSRCPGATGGWSPAYIGPAGSDGAAVGRAWLPRGRP
jgi:hypothetical protein